MHKPAFLNGARMARFVVSLLYGLGLLLPLMLAFDLGAAVPVAAGVFAAVVALLSALSTSGKGRLLLAGILAIAAAVQLFLPNGGFFGASYEAFKAISLYFSSVPSAVRLYSGEIAALMAAAVALLAFAFTSREIGFLPAALLLVLALFGVWSLGKQALLWYFAPALVALLLLVSQTSHEKINLFEVLPMAAIVVALAMLLLPRGQVTIPPLYDAAMDLKQTISDYLFFTEPRNVFTLGSYGYYPMGSGKLGGEAQPSDYPVMIVKTDRTALLRAVAKDEYTGRSWRDTSSAKRYLYVNPRWSSLRRSVFLENMPAEAVRGASTLLDEQAVSVQMQNNAASTVFTPLFLRDYSAQSDMVAYFNDASELFITRDLERDDRYTVIAPVFSGGDAGLGALVEAAPKGGDGYYTAAKNEYLALPDHMEQRVYDDLQNIIASSSTAYDRACAVMRHLQRYYKYSLAPVTPPENQDFVTYFLYVGKEGYCTYFASAMTVLCRMAGLPARYVEGFLAQPGADGLAYVTGKSAHAWTEVYFEGFGWIPFDATPAQENVDNQQNQNDPEPSPSPEPTPSPSPEPDEQPSPPPNDAPPSDEPSPQDNEPETDSTPPDDPFPWWWLLLAVALAAAFTALGARRMPARVAARMKDERDRLFVYGSATYQLVRLGRRAPAAGETPLMFARRMDKQKAFPVPILPLWRMMALSNYSRMKPGPEQTARAKEAFLRMYKSQRAFAKLRFRMRALFDRRFYAALDTRLAHVEPPKRYAHRFGAQNGKRAKCAGKRVGKRAARPDPAREANAAGRPDPAAAPARPADPPDPATTPTRPAGRPDPAGQPAPDPTQPVHTPAQPSPDGAPQSPAARTLTEPTAPRKRRAAKER